MKTDALFFTLLLITATLTHTSNNPQAAANGSYRLPRNKNFRQSRVEPIDPSKSVNTNPTK